MVEKSRDILALIYARHLKTINQINFTFREIELIACLLHTRGIKKIALILNIAPKTVGTHIRNINLKINCNSQDGIIKFIESSGKLEIIKEFYNNIFHPAGPPTGEATSPMAIDETQANLSQDCVAAIGAEPASILRSLNNPVARMDPHFWKKTYAFALLTILMVCLLIFIPYQFQIKEELPVRSDLIVPMDAVLLQRSDLMSQIDKKFKKQSGIQSLALIGPGGSGKTTTARQYGIQQHTNTIWEINAETRSSLSESFENLAHALSKTEEDQKMFKAIREIKNPTEREEKILEFVEKRLKLYSNWFLIYDNVENFADIQKYFPQDRKTWGEGKIILTTRNTNIQNNSQINGIILVGELTPNQKLSLFMQIMNHGENRELPTTQQKEVIEFLKKIPPFPLDISVAAYYLKTMNVPFGRYLEHLNNQDKSFSTIQENLLKEGGTYEKTRYSIITLSLEKLMAADKNFGDLLLFISVLDSQNIPRDLLDLYKGKSVVDNFIYYLKKYSLVVNPLSDADSLLSHISIHRSTQDISFSYLANFLKLNKDNQSHKAIAYALDDYSDQALEQEDFPKMQVTSRHIENVLKHHDLLTDFSKGLLESKLGSIYYFINDDKSKQMLADSLNLLERKSLEHLSPEDKLKMARSLLQIGAIYTELRFDKNAQEAFEKAVHLYRKKESKNYADLSWALSYLGNIHRKLGNYEKARNYLEESIQLHKQYSADHKRLVRTLAYLGATYRGLGLYQQSLNTLEESLALYKEHYSSDDHYRAGWILVQLGQVYRNLGNPQKAKGYLENGLLIFQKSLPDHYVSIGIALVYLGNCYRELGDNEKSRTYLEKSLKIHKKHFDKNHVKMGWVLFHLANTNKAIGKDQEAQQLFERVLEIYSHYCNEENIQTARILRDMAKIYLEKNRLDDAEKAIKQSLKILHGHKHVSAYKSLELLGEIYLKKAAYSLYAKNDHERYALKRRALDTFNQALHIAKQHLPTSSVHIEKIRFKINNI